MIKALILFYLNIKPTHGYEIQKFLQVSGTDQWAKIQSGSIYYAITKLEKEKFIKVRREERTGSRVRKIYEITESGKEEMHKELIEELSTPITTVGSFKFLTYPILCELAKDEIKIIVERHVKELNEQLIYWLKWREVKINGQSTHLEALSFDMTIESLQYQIKWHEELTQNIDLYQSQSEVIRSYISAYEFSDIDTDNKLSEVEEKILYTEVLKKEILKDPSNAINNLDKILEELKNQIKPNSN